MKRIIKFRAWTRTGEWDESGERRQFEMIDGDSLCPMECEPFKDILADIEDEYYVMQFTGLSDGTGKDIYEGDILKKPNNNFGYCSPDEKDYALYIVDDMINFHYDYMDHCIPHDEIEVIGNIYENPELLNS